MIHFREIAAHYGIGHLLAAPAPVLGGLLHTTYRLDTAEGSFAVKILNAAVMKRPDALDNMIRSEKIASAMRPFIPAVAAIEADGSPVSLIGGEYVMLYPWLTCKPVLPPRVTSRHASVIGDLLARMHCAGEKLYLSSPDLCGGSSSEEASGTSGRNWEELLRQAEASAPDAPWLPEFREATPGLISQDGEIRASLPFLRSRALSHRDLDPKNVMWDGTSPYVIDWEAAGDVHPAAELLETLLSWSDNGQGQPEKERFLALLEAYRAIRDISGEPWDAVFAASPDGMADWLAYNIRRASGLETVDAHDRLVGASEVSGTLRLLSARRAALPVIREWMEV
jgi:Ser/Thr protein kinase RdoA (MazF antagonist)